MTDFYQILGVERSANSIEIRAAFKSLAMKYHPDRNPNDPNAEEQFKLINEAYHTLTDPLKKSRYDRRYFNYGNTVADTDDYWREAQAKRYKKWHYQYKPAEYKFDRNYFRIQGLAFLVFIIISGFCFGAVHLTFYLASQREAQVQYENTLLLVRVNSLFDKGKFEEALNLIDTLRSRDPSEYRFHYTRDSLVDELENIANSEFNNSNFLSAVKHYNVLKLYENGSRLQTLNKIASCEYFLGHYEKSVQALKHMHNQQPWNLGLIYEIGLINYEKLNNKEEALQYFTLGKKQFKENLTEVYGAAFEIVMDPADAPDVYFQIFTARAKVNIDLKNYKEAITDCNWAIFLRPHKGETYNLRAIAKFNQKEYWYICEDLEKAMLHGFQASEALQRKYCAH